MSLFLDSILFHCQCLFLCLDYLRFQLGFKFVSVNFPDLFFFFKSVLGILKPLHFHVSFWKSLFISTKNCLEFGRNCVVSIEPLEEKNCYFNSSEAFRSWTLYEPVHSKTLYLFRCHARVTNSVTVCSNLNEGAYALVNTMTTHLLRAKQMKNAWISVSVWYRAMCAVKGEFLLSVFYFQDLWTSF